MRALEDDLPEYGEWMSVKEVAEFWTRAHGVEVNAATIRRWCRDKNWRLQGVDVRNQFGRIWIIERGSLLKMLEERAKRVLVVCEEERGKEWRS